MTNKDQLRADDRSRSMMHRNSNFCTGLHIKSVTSKLVTWIGCDKEERCGTKDKTHTNSDFL
jgi:hypothetical protein